MPKTRLSGRGRGPVARGGEQLGKFVLVMGLVTPFLFPLWWLLVTAFKPRNEVFVYPPTLIPRQWRLENFTEVLTTAPFLQQTFNSLYIGTVTVLGILLVAVPAGYVFARMKVKGLSIIFVLVLGALLVPYETTLVPLFQLSRTLGWMNTHVPLIVFIVFGPPVVFATFLMRQAFLTFPSELEDAARIDGLRLPGLLWYVAIPAVRPAVGAVAILSFITSWNSFLHPLVFVSTPEKLTLPLAILQYTDVAGAPLWNLQFTATLLSVIPMVVVYLFAQRSIRETFSGSGIVG